MGWGWGGGDVNVHLKTNGMEGRKKYLKFKRFQTGSANTWENTLNSDESTDFERVFPRFCTCACQQCLMISVQNHAFSTILWLRCEEMHVENRQQYSAPAGALTLFLALCGCSTCGLPSSFVFCLFCLFCLW